MESVTTRMAYGTVILTLDNVLLPKDKLSPTPSFHDGLDEETEKDLRITGCELIQSSGILLKLPQTAMATAQVLFQRFYFSKSFVRQPMETTAMACVYLASKIEEAPRRIRDVINVFHHIRQYRSSKPIQPLILDPAYIRLKSDVTLAERRILKELGFCVHVKHPHKLIVIYMQQLGYGNEKEFMQKAWNYMNDALRTTVFVAHTPEAIACACIYLTARMLNITLPASWFLVFDIKEDELILISTQIVELYERQKINFDELDSKVQILIKQYQEARQNTLSSRTTEKANEEATATPTKETGNGAGTQIASVPAPVPIEIKLKENQPLIAALKEEIRKKSPQRGTNTNTEINGSAKRKQEQTPPSKARRGRRSPSPIVYSESPSRDRDRDSRHRHKKEKRKKYSSRSRSHDRDRRMSSKKRRERTPEDSGRHHHKRKYYHR